MRVASVDFVRVLEVVEWVETGLGFDEILVADEEAVVDAVLRRLIGLPVWLSEKSESSEEGESGGGVAGRLRMVVVDLGLRFLKMGIGAVSAILPCFFEVRGERVQRISLVLITSIEDTLFRRNRWTFTCLSRFTRSSIPHAAPALP